MQPGLADVLAVRRGASRTRPRRLRAGRQQADGRHLGEVAHHRHQRHALQQRLPDDRVVEVLRRDALARQAVLADQPDDGRAVGGRASSIAASRRGRSAATSGYDATASPRLTARARPAPPTTQR